MKKNKELINKFAIIVSFFGIIFMFTAVWSHGWIIVRSGITGILLLLWGQSVFSNERRKCQEGGKG